MKTVLINECSDTSIQEAFIFDLSETKVNHCIGGWTCWWRTPGKCIYKNLEEFYRGCVNADQAVFYAKLHEVFISSKMKLLFDRMIPPFLPCTSYGHGGTNHTLRYPQYPNVEFYYDYTFEDEVAHRILYDYIYEVFDQLYAKKIG